LLRRTYTAVLGVGVVIYPFTNFIARKNLEWSKVTGTVRGIGIKKKTLL
jgi:hypothetical protein